MYATRELSFANFRRIICRAVAGIMIGLMVMGCAPRPSPIPEGTDKHWYGNIVSGEKFGINIGDDYSAAKDILVEDGFSSRGVFSCSENRGVVFACSSDSHEIARFRLRRLGKDGSVSLEISEGSVVRIVWSFSPVRIP